MLDIVAYQEPLSWERRSYKKRSEIWEHFSTEAGDRAECKLCRLRCAGKEAQVLWEHLNTCSKITAVKSGQVQSDYMQEVSLQTYKIWFLECGFIFPLTLLVKHE